jgi:predicted patatin/cPLA2 family phospholipase
MSCLYQHNEIIQRLETITLLENTISELEYMNNIDNDKYNNSNIKKLTNEQYNDLCKISLTLNVTLQDFKPLIKRIKEIHSKYKEINEIICDHENIIEDWFDQSPDNYGDKQIKVKYCRNCGKTFNN